MKIKIKNIEGIDVEWLTKPTGDPFVDVGGIVIKYFFEKYPGKDILDLIEEITKIYVIKWKAKLHSFFHGSKITNPSVKGDAKKISETIKVFHDIISNKQEHKKGICRISGRNTVLFRAGIDNTILAGSGGFINFHHGFEEGLFLSKEVLIRLYFIPFGVEYLGDKIALIHSNSYSVTDFFVKNKLKGIDGHFSRLVQRNNDIGVLKSEFYNPVNALFDFADKCISEMKKATYDEEIENDDIEDISLNLYHFTNFITSPDIKFYNFPAIIFDFYRRILKDYRSDWQVFIRNHYTSSKFKGAKFNEETEQIYIGEKVAGYDEYKIWHNKIYEKLLNNQSILGEIRNWSINRKFNYIIVEYYQIYVRNMEKKTLEKIKELADFVVKEKDTDNVKKSITRLNGSRSSQAVRLFLLKLVDKNYQEKNEKPLISLEDYVQYLFPDGINWREIRDLLLIAIYQKLHEKQIQIELEIPETELEIIEE